MGARVEGAQTMGIRRSVKRALAPHLPDLLRLPRRRLVGGGLSPDLLRKTEIDHDLSGFPDNDLYRYFRADREREMPKMHHYFEIYDQWLAPLRGKADLKFCEIGVARGGSLKMWRGYFHRGARIVGLDIDPACKARERPGENVFVEIGDQTDTAFLDRVIADHGPFDIVIDDGGHTTAQQTISFNHLYAHGLKAPGVYLVEDLQTNYWPEFRDSDQTFVDLAKASVDRLNECYLDNRSVHHFQEGHREQRRKMTVSAFCAATRAVAFYDSIVVFEKRRKTVPVLERRS